VPWRRHFSTVFFISVTSIVLPACSGYGAAPAPSDRTPAPVADRTSAPIAQQPYRPLTFAYERPIVGAEVRVTADGLPAGKNVDLMWTTVTGGWVIEDYYYFRGKKYQPAETRLGQFPVDAAGRLDARFRIPEDYGGVHEVLAVIDGRTIAQKGIEVTQSFEMRPASGPVGTPIELVVKGLGFRVMESTWVVNWDNSLAGFVSAASSRGSAVARFRAAGPAGAHVVDVLSGFQGLGYLNHEQAPNDYLPRPRFSFQTTAERPASLAPYAEPYPTQPTPETELSVSGLTAALAPTQGPVGTRTTLTGHGFPAGKPLQLVWQTSVGSRVSGEGFGPSEVALPGVTVGADGRLNASIAVPEDLGGLHGIAVRDGDRTLARVFFVIETSIAGISRTSGPVGTPVTIHLKGVGWTEYDNIYIATYDNAYMGYACGFNSQGDVVINFHATGAPGIHIIDLYPGIYQGPPSEPQLLYKQPQLTYADDHPGNKIPALRFMFDVTAK
jgi:hypothetical protein